MVEHVRKGNDFELLHVYKCAEYPNKVIGSIIIKLTVERTLPPERWLYTCVGYFFHLTNCIFCLHCWVVPRDVAYWTHLDSLSFLLRMRKVTVALEIWESRAIISWVGTTLDSDYSVSISNHPYFEAKDRYKILRHQRHGICSSSPGPSRPVRRLRFVICDRLP